MLHTSSFILLAACSPQSQRADLVFIQSAEPETLDPALVTDQVSMRLSEALFEGLCRVNEKGDPEPGVAERWDVAADKKHYVFHLRSNSRWSNGQPVVAEDFVYAWRRALDPDFDPEAVLPIFMDITRHMLRRQSRAGQAASVSAIKENSI